MWECGGDNADLVFGLRSAEVYGVVTLGRVKPGVVHAPVGIFL